MNIASVFHDIKWRCCVQEMAHKAVSVGTENPSAVLDESVLNWSFSSINRHECHANA
jgi:hypothetical protein